MTYDKKGISARMGLTHNDGYIWSYAGAPDKGPGGDTYLYPHTQVDAQVSYWIPRGHGLQAIVSMLNLNNEVFGFYNGSERYPIQREYYSRTISLGLRWTLPAGSEPVLKVSRYSGSIFGWSAPDGVERAEVRRRPSFEWPSLPAQ